MQTAHTIQLQTAVLALQVGQVLEAEAESCRPSSPVFALRFLARPISGFLSGTSFGRDCREALELARHWQRPANESRAVAHMALLRPFHQASMAKSAYFVQLSVPGFAWI